MKSAGAIKAAFHPGECGYKRAEVTRKINKPTKQRRVNAPFLSGKYTKHQLTHVAAEDKKYKDGFTVHENVLVC